MAGSKPVLWQIRISHYSEKVRWALDYKGVDYEGKAPPAGAHMLVALALTRGRHKTFPVLQLEGHNIGDSTAIIAALDERYPEPPLYPEDREEQRRALELEDWFDEELGPQIRLLVWHEATRDPGQMAGAVAADIPRPLRRLRGAGVAAARYATAFAGVRYGVKSSEAAELARGKVLGGARPSGGRARRQRVPGRRSLQRCRPDRGRAVLSARLPPGGTDGAVAGGL